MSTGRPTNRLAQAASPYLLSHAHNPVDWYPWGPEALERAKREDKPVFVSIGYAACHWCHVMERESFEDEAVAQALNRDFIAIKVDREERPDVDQLYMTATIAMTGSGGWPMSVFITPDGRPFFAGTYFPKESKYGRPGFIDLLSRIAQLWQKQRTDVERQADTLLQALQDEARTAPPAALPPSLEKDAVKSVLSNFDEVHGGFGPAPKFPAPFTLALLLRHAVEEGDDNARHALTVTLDRMAAGGIYDHVGGGFARYSTDKEWHVPHFEKMLYDNAQLLDLYLDCHLVSGKPRFSEVAHGIVRYVLRDLTHPAGGFYSAEDADSEGKEGKFYCWTRDELAAVLDPADLELATRVFDITPDGNFVDHSDPAPLRGQNVLSLQAAPRTAGEAALLRSLKDRLFRARAARVRPHLDDKILASWNGLMLGALARAAAVFDDADYRQAAIANAEFVMARLWDADTRTLYHRWRDGERDATQLLESYAGLLHGVVELYQLSLDATHLAFAVELAEQLIARFHDAKAGGFWQSVASADDLILRLKDDYDGAEPSGNSMATRALLKLAAITGRADFETPAARTLALFAGQMMHMPRAMTSLWQAADFALTPTLRIVIAGDPQSASVRELLAAAHDVYHPHCVVSGVSGEVDAFTRSLAPVAGRATAWLCTGDACQPPTQDAMTLKQMLIAFATDGLATPMS